ncbi:MAG: Bax inhibitor-1/YccA family protein [Elusimicrobia bacterium]|nr:Bax inhibitor-1/YccA family protein [Elusimicrobiota bacterium]
MKASDIGYMPPAIGVGVQSFVAKVYNWMAMGLAVTAGCAWYMVSHPSMVVNLAHNPILFYGLLGGELLLVIGLSAAISRISAGTATAGFFFYSALNGVTLSLILLVYTQASVASAFLVAAGMFGGMALYGHATKKDLTSVGSFAAMALLGVIIASVVNMFVRSSGMDKILTYLSVLVFVALTAWDAQKIRRMAEGGFGDSELESKATVMGALALYLDFINLFLSLLRILGKRRE